MSRHNSIDALRERYHRSRAQSVGGSETTVPTTVYEEEEEEEEEEEYVDDDSYSMDSSNSSIPDENINFDLVYALHTFVATVDGQASVVKGDAMTLLDDTNSYWWLIRALKASEVGYIPAENIETPFERLARLNKHRNVQVTSLDQLQHYGPVSTSKTRKQKKKVQLSKELKCQLQVILTDENDQNVYEETFEKWEEDMPLISYMEFSDSDSDSSVEEAVKKKKDGGKNKYTPLLNPDFNRPINVEPAPAQNDNILEKSVSSIKPASPEPVELTVREEEYKPVVAASSLELLEKPLPAIQEQPLEQTQQPAQKVVTGLKRLLSIGSGNGKKSSKSTPDERGISSSSYQQQQEQNQPQQIQTKDDDKQYHVLRIFSGNINVGAMFNTVAVTPDMNADQLLKLALQKFHIPLLEENTQHRRPSSENGIEYYLTVKSMDGDEVTLEPQDKPLAIFESLSDHLTTPMPSLTYIKRLSMEQPTIKVTRVGVSKARQRAKARFGEDSVIRFSLHKRIRRTINTAAGQIYVKISFYAENSKQLKNMTSSGGTYTATATASIITKRKQERIDKLVAVSTTTLISELTKLAIEKFHLTPDETDESLYSMSLSLNGQETSLTNTRTISEILNDSELIPKGTVEKLFVLRKKVTNDAPPSPVLPTTVSMSESTSESTNRFVRYILKQHDKEAPLPLSTEPESMSNTGSVLKRLDEAILSLENDKRQLDKFQYNGSSPPPLNRIASDIISPTTKSRMLPVRSNSLSAVSRSNPKIAPIRAPADNMRRLPPVRSSSLKISGDVFDVSNKKSISNMDDLEMELKRIASSHKLP
ncbi:unnamed protein product [Mucor hiemalis]